MISKEMTLFYLLYYICILTNITFHECNYIKRALKKMSLQIKCFIMKLAFYPLVSYANESGIAAEEIIVDIMDVQIDDWMAVTYENSWFPGILFNVQSINSSHCILSITLLTYLMGIDPSLRLVKKAEWRICPSCGGMGEEGGWIEVRGGLSYISINIAVKSWNISPYIWLEQEALAFHPYIFTYIPILYLSHDP